MPTSLPASAVAAALDHRNAGNAVLPSSARARRRASRPGWMVSGFTTMPDSNLFTWRTCSACSSRLEIAVDDADAAGLRHGDGHAGFGHRVHRRGDDRDVERDLRVMRVRTSTSDGSTSDRPGLSSTSSKVNASTRFELLFTAIANSEPSQRVQAIPAANTCANIWTLREDLAPSPEWGPHFGLAMVDSTSRWQFIGHSQPSTCTGVDRPRGAIGSPSPEAYGARDSDCERP